MPLCGGNKVVQRKLVLLGDGACGKTSLLNVFTRGFFPTVYEPTVFENYVHDIFVDGIHMELSLWDTAGQEEFDRLRSLSYDDTQAIMLCFSVDNRGSLENVGTKWIAEINEHCPGVKIVLCALKCDLREEHEKEEDEPNTPPRPMIQYNEGLEVARRIGALRYLGMLPILLATSVALVYAGTNDFAECSAMRNRGVNEAFTEAARVALQVKPAKSEDDSKCSVM
ncbi:hypothetical protein PV08_02855 [Exophiala spinifera]|uniref:GTP-binding protein RHO3 n=1 Tax=Exophiala spinifera TaxID=91928 RepID=A0A0D2A0T0_9EURO|nr:uncharacterized protein PV08_02855 [Exophiala spinifera]KIW18567.1 hypothetical protein PV08_02855 [Exophiala spinifera]